MPTIRLRRAFDLLVEAAESDDERWRLQDAARAAELLITVPSAADRKAVIAVIEKLEAVVDAAKGAGHTGHSGIFLID